VPDAPELPAGAPEAPETRRGLVGPFTARHLAVALGSVVIVTAILLVATAPIAALPAAGIAPQPTQYAIGPAVEGLRVGDLAPELQVAGTDGGPAPLLNLSGAPVRLADLRGHPVWISFWASWCPPCQDETPVLRDTFNAYRARGLALVAISVQESTVDDVRAYAVKYGLDYTVAADLAGDVFRRYRIYGLPTQVFLDANGIIRSIVQGPVDADIADANLALIGLPPETASPPGSPATPPPAPTAP
jgi:cytochrome c biogenesis protein CcmG, thiol:disulfide interchange protein DsbE